MAETYVCAMCGGKFEKTMPDEQALAEMESHFGEVPESERAIVCDDCYQKINPADHPQKVRDVIRKLKGDS